MKNNKIKKSINRIKNRKKRIGLWSRISNAIKLEIKYKGTYYNRGICIGRLKDYIGAIQDFNKVIELDYEFMDAHFGRGICKYQLGGIDGACLDLSKAGELGYLKVYDVIKKRCN